MQRQKQIEEQIARLAAIAPAILARTVTVEDAVAVELCREGVVDFCNRYLDGRQAATIQEVIDAAAKVTDGHYLDSIERLVWHVEERSAAEIQK